MSKKLLFSKKQKKWLTNPRNQMIIVFFLLLIFSCVLTGIISYNDGYSSSERKHELEQRNKEYAEYAIHTSFMVNLERAGTILTLKLLDNLPILFFCFVLVVWGLSRWRLVEVSK